MAFTKDQNRQAPSVAIVDIAFSDLVSGVGKVVVDLPSGAILTGGAVIVDTAFDSGDSDALQVGDSNSAARYKDAIDGQATGLTALVPTGDEVDSADGSIMVEWTGAGTAITAGALRLIVEYIQTNRGDFVQR